MNKFYKFTLLFNLKNIKLEKKLKKLINLLTAV